MTNIETRIQKQAEKVYQAADHMDSTALNHLAELGRLAETAARRYRQKVREAHEYVEALGLCPEPFCLNDDQDVQVTMAKDYLRVEMEGILPFSMKGSVCYLHEKLETALEQFMLQNNLTAPIFREKCAVVFVHHCDRQGERYRRRQLRDFDNLEHRALMNTLSNVRTWDDGPCNIISMDRLRVSNREFTEILVMPIRRFREYVMSEDMVAR